MKHLFDIINEDTTTADVAVPEAPLDDKGKKKKELSEATPVVPDDVTYYTDGENRATVSIGDWHEKEEWEAAVALGKSKWSNFEVPDDTEIGQPDWSTSTITGKDAKGAFAEEVISEEDAVTGDDKIDNTVLRLRDIGEMADTLAEAILEEEDIDDETFKAISDIYDDCDKLYAEVEKKYDIDAEDFFSIDIDDSDVELDEEEELTEAVKYSHIKQWITSEHDFEHMRGYTQSKEVESALIAASGVDSKGDLSWDSFEHPVIDSVATIATGKDKRAFIAITEFGKKEPVKVVEIKSQKEFDSLNAFFRKFLKEEAQTLSEALAPKEINDFLEKHGYTSARGVVPPVIKREVKKQWEGVDGWALYMHKQEGGKYASTVLTSSGNPILILHDKKGLIDLADEIKSTVDLNHIAGFLGDYLEEQEHLDETESKVRRTLEIVKDFGDVTKLLGDWGYSKVEDSEIKDPDAIAAEVGKILRKKVSHPILFSGKRGTLCVLQSGKDFIYVPYSNGKINRKAIDYLSNKEDFIAFEREFLKEEAEEDCGCEFTTHLSENGFTRCKGPMVKHLKEVFSSYYGDTHHGELKAGGIYTHPDKSIRAGSFTNAEGKPLYFISHKGMIVYTGDHPSTATGFLSKFDHIN